MAAGADLRRKLSREQLSRLDRDRPIHDALRRFIDLSGALAGLAVLSPLLLVIAVAIKLDSRGPVLYRQVRIGKDRRQPASDRDGGRRTGDLTGSPFVIYKFRTMKHQAEHESGMRWAGAEDERVTRLGAVLRNLSLDELPQLWNVVRGDMALVGPRPERPGFVNELRRQIPEYALRHQVKPGMTGWAQLHQPGDQTVSDVRRKVDLDLQYIWNRSLWFDLKILLFTPLVVADVRPERLAPALIAPDGERHHSTLSESGGPTRAGTVRRTEDRGAAPAMESRTPPMEHGWGGFGIRGQRSEPTLLVASDRDWLVTSMEEILEPAGVRIRQARDGQSALRMATIDPPEFAIVDESFPHDGAVQLCRDLVTQRLPFHVPVALYSSSVYARSDLHREALNAGAWFVIREPLQAGALVALVRRLLTISSTIATRSEGRGEFVDSETGLLTLTGLRRVLPRLGALALRNDAPVSCLVLSASRMEDSESVDRGYRIAAAEVCSPNVRSSDVCGWMNRGEIVIVAYDTPAEGAKRLVERLNSLARERNLLLKGSDSLSAGVVELHPQDGLQQAFNGSCEQDITSGLTQTEFRDLYSLSAARDALRRARAQGGGIEVAEVA